MAKSKKANFISLNKKKPKSVELSENMESPKYQVEFYKDHVKILEKKIKKFFKFT